jgi:hypothetical protein
MLGSDFKRGVATTLERIFGASRWTFDKLEIQWCGKGASVSFQDWGNNHVTARFMFPNVDDNKSIPKKALPKFIGMVLHELGHAWFTDNAPWDMHNNNPTLSRLINGLEDPRIERKVIEQGIAANAAPLFENLINEMMDGKYCEPDDFGNIAFQLAVEGRRLNGYRIALAPVYTKSRYRVPIEWALGEAHKAQSTLEIVRIAEELLKRLNKIKPSAPQPDAPQQGDGPADGPGDGPSDGPGDAQEGEGQGEGNKPADGPAEGDSDDPAEGPANGKGGGERPIEPDLAEELKPHACDADAFTPRPSCRTVSTFNFDWS